VKAALDVGALDDSLAKGTAFKQLRMTINADDHVITTQQQAFMKQIGLVPPYFVLAFENKIAIKTLLDRLQQAELVSPPAGKSLGAHDDANASRAGPPPARPPRDRDKPSTRRSPQPAGRRGAVRAIDGTG
jgi:hypothetical protein